MIDEGNALEEQGRIAEAMARYGAAVEADPQCARAHLNRGNILLADAGSMRPAVHTSAPLTAIRNMRGAGLRTWGT